MNLNEQAKIVHKANEKWWQDPRTQQPIKRNKRELAMLIISEIAEAMEGERKNLMDDKLPHRKMAEVEMVDAYIRILDFSAGFGFNLMEFPPRADYPKNNKAEALFAICVSISELDEYLDLASEHCAIKCGSILSNVIFEIRSYCLKHGYDLEGAYAEKMAYNATREDHKHEARLIAGGKQF